MIQRLHQIRIRVTMCKLTNKKESLLFHHLLMCSKTMDARNGCNSTAPGRSPHEYICNISYKHSTIMLLM